MRNHGFQKHFDRVIASLRQQIERLEAEQAIYSNPDNNQDDDNHDTAELETTIAQLTEKVEALQKVQDDFRKANSMPKLIERLNDAIRDSETLSTQLETNMLSNNMDFTDFVREYTACRKLYHERRQKLEQLKLEQRNSYGNDYFGR